MHGLIVDHVYQVVEYEPKPCFRHSGESVSTARRAGDADSDKAIIADTMKLPEPNAPLIRTYKKKLSGM